MAAMAHPASIPPETIDATAGIVETAAATVAIDETEDDPDPLDVRIAKAEKATQIPMPPVVATVIVSERIDTVEQVIVAVAVVVIAAAVAAVIAAAGIETAEEVPNESGTVTVVADETTDAMMGAAPRDVIVSPSKRDGEVATDVIIEEVTEGEIEKRICSLKTAVVAVLLRRLRNANPPPTSPMLSLSWIANVA
jgi:hypothetical protein